VNKALVLRWNASRKQNTNAKVETLWIHRLGPLLQSERSSVERKCTVKMNMLYLINRIVATDYKHKGITN